MDLPWYGTGLRISIIENYPVAVPTSRLPLMADVTYLLNAIEEGDSVSAERLFPLV